MSKRKRIGVLFLILAALLLWGCRGGSHTINVSVIDQKLYGAGPGEYAVFRVKEGDPVIMRINVDEPMEVLLHGYDLEARVKPGETGTIQFTANIPGFHALMIHGLGGSEGIERRVEILLALLVVEQRQRRVK